MDLFYLLDPLLKIFLSEILLNHSHLTKTSIHLLIFFQKVIFD